MRILVTGFAMMALAAAPCAWDTDPREPSAIAALFAIPIAPTDAHPALTSNVPVAVRVR